jgi:hypothetical protein
VVVDVTVESVEEFELCDPEDYVLVLESLVTVDECVVTTGPVV